MKIDNRILVKQIQDTLLTKTGKLNSAVIRRDKFQTSELNQRVTAATSFLPEDCPFAQRIHAVLNNLSCSPTCVCGKELQWAGYKGKEYYPFCSNVCARTKVKWKSCSQTKKIKTTELEVKFKLLPIIQPTKQQIDEVIEKYLIPGCNVTMCSRLFKLGHASVLKYLQSKHHNGAMASFAQILYDYKNSVVAPPTCSKCGAKLTFRNGKYGYRTCGELQCKGELSGSNRAANHNTYIRAWLADNNLKLLTSHGVNNGSHDIVCDMCTTSFKASLKDGRWQVIQCPKCFPRTTSRFQQQVQQYIATLTDHPIEENVCIPGNDTKHQLDIYIPSLKFAVECNGVYWHSERHKRIDRDFHVNKTNQCEDQGIQLIQIWDCEWTSKQSIVKSILSAKLGRSQYTVDARKCKVMQITNAAKSRFLNDNHLQGNDSSSVSFALVDDEDVVSIMTFGKRKITGSKQTSWELMRFCNSRFHNVRGAASRLFSAFIKQYQPRTVTSYADRRFSNGNLYRQLGFILDHNSTPGYWYYVDYQLKHRSGYMKHKLSKRLNSFDPNLTEIENMTNNGYFRVWDCGHSVFRWNAL